MSSVASVPARRQRAQGRTARLSVLTHVPAVLRELGCSPDGVLGALGFRPAYFADPDLPMPYAAAAHLLERCSEVTGCEHFGLLVGQRAEPSNLGLAGFVAMTAPTVGDALADLLRFFDLHDRGAVVWLRKQASTCLLGYTVVEPAALPAVQMHDMSLAVGCNIMRSLCGSAWRPVEVQLARPAPRSAGVWTRVFRTPVRFESGHSAIAFSDHWLARSTPVGNPQLHLHLQREAQRQSAGARRDFASEVRAALSGMMAEGECTAAGIAQLMGMHARTLNRRLFAEATTFRALRDEVRYGMSREMLRNTRMTLGAIAATLGYAEASVFVRAFARWSGSTPQQWRDGQARVNGRRGAPATPTARTGNRQRTQSLSATAAAPPSASLDPDRTP